LNVSDERASKAANGREEREKDVPDEDGGFHHPVSFIGRDGAHENLLFKKPI